jgi:hypothetical protein
VDADDGGKRLGSAFREVDIQQIILSVAAVGNVPAFRNTGRKRDGGVPLPVTAGGAEIEHETA